MITIRDEQEADIRRVHELNSLAFEAETEANLVDVLRETTQPVISLVATDNDIIIGHIMFTPVELSDSSSLTIMGLAPMAVAPDRQRCGIGSALANEGLNRCAEIGTGAVVVLGHSAYYPRFGFVPASTMSIACEYDVPDEVFMIRELTPGYLAGATGTIKYHEAFAETT
jgi:putative acetyltransferase